MESIEEYIDRVIKGEKRWKKERTLKDLIKGTRTYKGTKRAFIVETKQRDSPDKIIVSDELEFPDTGEKRLRFGYYIRGENRGLTRNSSDIFLVASPIISILLTKALLSISS